MRGRQTQFGLIQSSGSIEIVCEFGESC